MPGTPTTKYAIPTLAGTTLARDIDTETNAGLTAIDSKMVGQSSGPIGSIPTSTPGSPGIVGREYYATDIKQWFKDTGTSWVEITTNPPYIEASRSSDLSVANNSAVNVPWQSTSEENGSNFTLGGSPNNHLLTLSRSGIYLVDVGVEWAPSATGRREHYLLRNGSTVKSLTELGQATIHRTGFSVPLSLGAGQTLSVQVFQNSGGALNLLISSQTYLRVARLGGLT